jgi:hypothetical protein
MTLTAAVILLSWAVVATLERIGSNIAPLVAATLIAVMLSTLGIGHVAAFLVRRMQASHRTSGMELATLAAPAPGDCGCRGGTVRRGIERPEDEYSPRFRFRFRRSRLETIFVQIASYRDSQLPLTIADCLAKARRPERIIFGVCWQRDATETLGEIARIAQVKLITVPYQDSEGVCWARNKIQRLYDGEDYTLQLDSHSRFVPRWDEKCIRMMKRLDTDGIERPLLTAYAPPFNPNNDPAERGCSPCKIAFDKFTPQGSVSLKPTYLSSPNFLSRPVRARFYSAHFAFTLGRFCLDVPHDPELYFHGEEITISVRAFTHGYNLYHPDRVILWHDYSRTGRPKHWDDHSDWHLSDSRSHRRLRALLGAEPPHVHQVNLGAFGLGTAKSLYEYERYAGICFARRTVHQYTLNDLPPPNPDIGLSEEAWLQSLCKKRRYTVRLGPQELPTADDCDFWFVGAHDQLGREIHRQDLDEDAIWQIDRSQGWTKTIEFLSDSEPVTWTVWPHSKIGGWQQKTTNRA